MVNDTESLARTHSPYFGSNVKIKFAGNMLAFVPQNIIATHPKFSLFLEGLEYSKLQGHDFSDVSKRVGHIILHYLYSGQYQALPMVQDTPEKTHREEFSEAVNVYLEACQMGLDGLSKLASAEIERQGQYMTIADIITIIDKDFYAHALQVEWLTLYLLRRASMKFEDVQQEDIKKVHEQPLTSRNLLSILLEANMELKKELQDAKKRSKGK
ncbi:hypothetical protein FHETE_2715 [Fusarium heterosporum]|uniref:BTB domain-containing protein n=1 Tax=Fusarium heterosporum TaxID=42747 RepID=A0A8H5TMJ8_FUSHE|nr:hypothetical protein FHETE_2715 [Fusarium heterosporum]